MHFGDNAFYRFASYLFIGSSAGYISAILMKNVIVHKFVQVADGGITNNEIFLLAVLAIFHFVVCLRRSAQISFLGICQWH